MWTEIRLWLLGAGVLFVAVLVWMLLAELINLRWHDLGASAGASAVILLMLVLARLMTGIWLDFRKTQREYDERHRQFEERRKRIESDWRGR
jgi:hypothetical protein